MDMNQIPKAGFQYGKVANHTETASETAKKMDMIGIWLFSQPPELSVYSVRSLSPGTVRGTVVLV